MGPVKKKKITALVIINYYLISIIAIVWIHKEHVVGEQCEEFNDHFVITKWFGLHYTGI